MDEGVRKRLDELRGEAAGGSGAVGGPPGDNGRIIPGWLKAHRARAEAYRKYMERLVQGGSDPKGLEGWGPMKRRGQ